MTAVVLRGMGERRLRVALSLLAVVLGVAMIAGTYVQTDQMRAAFGDITKVTNQGSDIVVQPREAFTSTFTTSPEPMDAGLVDRIAAVPGVAAADGRIYDNGALVVRGDEMQSSYAPSAVLTVMRTPFEPTQMVRGHRPSRSGEIAVSRKAVSDERLRLGQRLGLSTRTGVHPVVLVGVFDYGNASSLGGATLISATRADAERWLDRRGKVTAISAAAQPGVTPEVLARRVRAALPDDLVVHTGEQEATRQAKQINDQLGSLLTPALLALGGAAVLVGAFIIFNTFSITVAQRSREFALLRTLGATRAQILALVTGEALLIGAAASGIGLVAGLGFARVLGALFDAAGFGIPRGDMTLAPRTIALALGVGTVVTLLSAFSPALRATRVPPVAALLAAELAPRQRRWAPWLAAVVIMAGFGLLTAGLLGAGPATSRLSTMGAGVVLLFVGVALSARYVVRPLASIIGWPIERLLHTMGRLARENAVRQPGRTATTSAALMVGLGMVVFVAVFAEGLKSSIRGSFDDLIHSQLTVTSTSLKPLPAGAAAVVRNVSGVRSATPQYVDAVRVNRDALNTVTDVLNGVDAGTLRDFYRFEWRSGSDARVRDLHGDGALVEEQFAKTHGIRTGDSFTVTTPAGGRTRLRAIGEYRDPMLIQGLVVDTATYRRLSRALDPWALWVATQPGSDQVQVQRSVARALARFPGADVQSNAEYRQTINAQLDQIVYLLYALLAMSVVISLFGIANSLFLSIHERTREFGLLRAVGATRGQIRRLVRYESVITSAIGGLLGIGLGLVLAFLMTQALSDLGLSFSVPVIQLAGFLLLAVMVGVVGAVLPARRGARIDVLRALRAE